MPHERFGVVNPNGEDPLRALLSESQHRPAFPTLKADFIESE